MSTNYRFLKVVDPDALVKNPLCKRDVNIDPEVGYFYQVTMKKRVANSWILSWKGDQNLARSLMHQCSWSKSLKFAGLDELIQGSSDIPGNRVISFWIWFDPNLETRSEDAFLMNKDPWNDMKWEINQHQVVCFAFFSAKFLWWHRLQNNTIKKNLENNTNPENFSRAYNVRFQTWFTKNSRIYMQGKVFQISFFSLFFFFFGYCLKIKN